LNSSSDGLPGHPALPEEFRLLCMLHNIGATKMEKSMSIEEVVQWTEVDVETLRNLLQKLRELGYVEFVEIGGTEKYHVTPIGITKVMTLYS
jgi:predicted transcriptional regulator of viral defense system